MIVEITQYVRPDGRPRNFSLVASEECYLKHELIQSCGCRITCGQLNSGEIAQYITNVHGDFAMKITPANDTEAADNALLEMISEFDKNKFMEWIGQKIDRQWYMKYLVDIARKYGHQGDYVAVRDFVRFCFREEGMEPPADEELEPYE